MVIHEKQSAAIKRAELRAEGQRIKAIEAEGRENHMKSFLGLWDAAAKAFIEVTATMRDKHTRTAEYELRTGSALMLTLEDGRAHDVQAISTRQKKKKKAAKTKCVYP